MLLKTIPLKARIENQPYGIAGILYHGTEIYESWTTLLLNPTFIILFRFKTGRIYWISLAFFFLTERLDKGPGQRQGLA